jgi:hypothetical protein
MIFKPSRPSIGVVRKEEGPKPRAFNQIGTRPPGRWDNARRSTAPAPQSQPVTHASRLVAQITPSVALGLGVRILAAGPAHVRLYTDSSRCVNHSSKVAQACPRAPASADSSPAAGFVSQGLARQESLSETVTRGERTPAGSISQRRRLRARSELICGRALIPGGRTACARSIQNLPTRLTHPPRTGAADRTDSHTCSSPRAPRIDSPYQLWRVQSRERARGCCNTGRQDKAMGLWSGSVVRSSPPHGTS